MPNLTQTLQAGKALVFDQILTTVTFAASAPGRSRNRTACACAPYRTLELPGANPLKDAHAALDAAVLAAYGFSAKKDLLAQLLELNLCVAQRLEQAEPVTPPGIPATFPHPETLVSDDCIRPPVLA